MNSSVLKKNIHIIAILLIPVLYIVIAFLFQSICGYYFLHCIDPEYCYLFNGLNIAQYSLKVWHVDHPGTPLQILAAVVIRAVHLFHSKEPLLKDVLSNPDLYVHAINIAVFSINGTALLILGYVVNKISGNIILSIFLQLIPFITFLTLSLNFRINPENAEILSTILITIFLFMFINNKNINEKLTDKYLKWFSVIMGYTIALKITFFPVFFVPFFLFDSFRKKASYCLYSFLSFVIFIIPVVLYRLEYFKDWLKNLFLHTGMYGAGEANIVDKNAYINALKETFSFEEPFFTIVFFSLVITCLVYQVPFIKEKIKNKRFYKALLGITLSMLLQVILVAKQYKYHYLSPAILLIIPAMYLIISIYLNNFNIYYKNSVFLILIFLILFMDFKKIQEYYTSDIKRKKSLYETYSFVRQNFKNKPLVIVPAYYGCPYKEYSVYFGFCWSGEKMKKKYTKTLNELYPATYIYNGWDEMLHDWNDEPHSYIDILKKHKNIRLYSGDVIIEANVLSHIMYNINRIRDTKISKIFSNKVTNENIYDISYYPFSDNNTIEIICNADSIDKTGTSFIGSENQLFGNNNTQTAEKFRSGKYSVKLSKDNQYGLTYIIKNVRKGEHYKCSVWRHKSNNNATLVVTARNSSDFNIYENNAIQIDGDWGEIAIDFIVPDNINNNEIRIYAYNNTTTPAFFDDMKIIAY